MQNIILLHGALGSAEDLQPLSASLKNEGFTVHSFSFSGHGQTAFKPAFGIEQFATELEAYIAEAGLTGVPVFGYSMGGYAALQLAAKQKHHISHIITLGTKFNWSKDAVEKETALLNPEAMLRKIPAYAASLQKKHGSWQHTVTHTATLMKEIGDKQFLSPEILKNITTPVLLGIGDKDKMVSPDETTAVFKTLPNAAMYMLPNTKHPIDTVNTDLLARIITNFINA